METTLPTPENLQRDIERLEREHKALSTRVQSLEKQKPSTWGILFGNVLLLVLAGILLDYLGFVPPRVERLPLRARSVEADDFLLRDGNGKLWGRLRVQDDQAVLQRLDAQGKPLGDPAPIAKDAADLNPKR